MSSSILGSTISVAAGRGTQPRSGSQFDQIIQAYRQLIERAHTRGIKIFGATLTPFKGFFVPGTPFGLWSPGNEIKRQQVNKWIRTSGEFDGVIDFDRVLRDPDDPSQLSPNTIAEITGILPTKVMRRWRTLLI